ncbi:methyl-accepting chemotaxis protein [Herbaspirillum rubrisubalbicans]|uniref:Methyl-accepting chemotaxis protein n=1 Tax=Herbaspirillum rubrisubalbicans TaxID=80842 RepID=A0AAD0XJB6_9BURK|nr:methyl-accepting chemotaxis protein [Herbaspirillum rubrisubalbicans]ALU91751.1 methyl-accepting chemotaxis transducer transmembrane protein [Herbaspirillum rubrisubalbicans M1]AYR26719.1 methyl-accepting chemotaxis protein [Herbaspirillum rubrisubalbicans]
MKNLKIGARLTIGFIALLMLMIVMVGLGAWRLGSIGDATDAMIQVALKKERDAVQWHAAIKENGVRTFAVMKSDDPAVQQYFQKQIDAQSAKVSQLQKQVEAAITTPEEKQLFEHVGKLRTTYRETRQNIFDIKKAGDPTRAREMTDTILVKLMDDYANSVLRYAEFQKKVIDETAADINHNYRSGRSMLVILGACELVLGALLAWLLTRSITAPLNQALAIAQSVAAGDLSSRIDSDARDETGQLLTALKSMNDNLQDIVGRVRVGTESINATSREIATGNLDLSARTEQQAGSLEETASVMEQLTSTVKQNADNARQANQLAASASQVASQGGAVVDQVVATMSQIHASSEKIADIIGVIDSIAFQTNILALNAAVEAARAGEQGRGFAVVASEVRSLAQRSASAAKEIKQLIDESVAKVGDGSRLVAQAGDTMHEVVHSVARVTEIVGEITRASQEQSDGIGQVNLAIAHIDEATQQNAALVEEAAAAARSMQDQAASLTEAVSVFRLDTRVVATPPANLQRGTSPSTVVR